MFYAVRSPVSIWADANKVMVMRGFTELMPPSSERTSVLAAADEAGDLTANLLAFGRRDTGNEAVIDLGSNILKSTNLLQRLLGSTIRLEARLPDTAVWCGISEGQLNQVLLNLVTNAKHAMPKGGALQIQLVTLELALPEAQQHTLRAGEYARLCVIDDGIGMSTEVLAQAVDPFFYDQGYDCRFRSRSGERVWNCYFTGGYTRTGKCTRSRHFCADLHPGSTDRRNNQRSDRRRHCRRVTCAR